MCESRITRQRTFFSRSAKDLRRARRLYMRLIRASVMLDRSGNQIYIYAKRMRKVGLYAPLTPYKFIACSILKHAYKTDRNSAQTHKIYTFEVWLRRNGWEGYGYCGYWRRDQPKPELLPYTRYVRDADL